MNARQQHAGVDRLADKIISPGVQPLNMIGVVGARGEHQNRPVVAVAHGAADAEAVFAGQHQVENHQVRLFIDDPRRRQRAIAFYRHAQAVVLQVIAGQLGQALVSSTMSTCQVCGSKGISLLLLLCVETQGCGPLSQASVATAAAAEREESNAANDMPDCPCSAVFL